MKIINRYALLLISFMGLCLSLSSCQEEDLPNAGEPRILYVRVTNPTQADSLLGGALLNNLVAIMGENLQNTTEVWFNDQKAILNPTYVTNRSILVNVPANSPEVVTDLLTLVFRNQGKLEYHFPINIPAPVMTSMRSEYVADGDIAIIHGDFFFEPLNVFMSDGSEAVVESVSKTELRFRVPQGAPSGPITVKTNFGTVPTSFHFRDQRNILLNFDDKTAAGSWRSGLIENNPEHKIDGNYLVLRGKLNKNERAEDYPGGAFVMQFWGNSRLPQGNFIEGDPADYVLKFEAKVIEWYGSYLNITFAPWSNNGNQEYWSNLNARGLWRPWEAANANFHTNDEWITVTKPMTDMKYAMSVPGDIVYTDRKFDKNAAGSLSFWMVGTPVANASPVEVYIDNVRIVRK
jgi:hypothetical protein